jgi:hypothetical protein
VTVARGAWRAGVRAEGARQLRIALKERKASRRRQHPPTRHLCLLTRDEIDNHLASAIPTQNASLDHRLQCSVLTATHSFSVPQLDQPQTIATLVSFDANFPSLALESTSEQFGHSARCPYGRAPLRCYPILRCQAGVVTLQTRREAGGALSLGILL